MYKSVVASGLSKRYRIAKGSAGWIDAVSDVSFEVEVGEAVGLIGSNGAGKSTVLRMLSRVTRPTAGYADIVGSVGALLEVGTGFHPELTGRENTFLSGAILGMSRRDVSARFDDIVSFAEVEPFIDVPVKRYSSGMYARLGFAVAAFLKPAILIVDEILAVGDLGFQAKCISHMRGLSREGTSVIFVSHNLLAVADFCPRSLVLEDGRVSFDGPTRDAIAAYRSSLSRVRQSRLEAASHWPHEVRINGEAFRQRIVVAPNDPLQVELRIEQPRNESPVDIELNLVVEIPDGRFAIHLRNDLDDTALNLRPGNNSLNIDIEDLALSPGAYWLWLRVVTLNASTPQIWDTERLELHVAGDQRFLSIVQPRFRFHQVHGGLGGRIA